MCNVGIKRIVLRVDVSSKRCLLSVEGSTCCACSARRWRRTGRWRRGWRCASARPTRRPGGSPPATTSCSSSASASKRRNTLLILSLNSCLTNIWVGPQKGEVICPTVSIFFMFLCFRHGLGDTYNKLFCDPKLPFTECAHKWYAAQKRNKNNESQNVSTDEEDDNKDDATYEPKMSLRRSKRNSNCDREAEDTDALSELETLAKLGRNEESLPANHWFSERALETRLHHIAHAVQKCEWPTSANIHKASDRILQPETREDRKQSQKRHIAIDVETERAKLHALLSSPRAAHTSPRERAAAADLKGSGAWERDDASSDSGSRRSTPAPPPAHQRPSPAPAAPAAPAPAAPVDLSAPLDLSEAQDFSMGRRTPAADGAASALNAPGTPAKSRLDESLSRLMKRKNVVSVLNEFKTSSLFNIFLF